MKNFAKIFVLGTAIVVAPALAHATPITGTIGFSGNGTFNNTTGQFTPGANTFSGMDAFVLTGGTGTLNVFTAPNPVNFNAFNTSTLGTTIFTTTEGSDTLSFILTGLSGAGLDPAGSGFTGNGTLEETGFTDTPETFTLNTDAQGGTFTAAMTAATGIAPEPPSLMLLGTGLLGIAGIVHRKFAAKLRS